MKQTLHRTVLGIAIVAALLLPACRPAAQTSSHESTEQAIAQFERELEALRRELVYASQGRTSQASTLANVHARAYPRSPVSDLDLYALQGVEYYPPVRPELELSDAELERLEGTYQLIESPEGIDTVNLPSTFRLEPKSGQLVALAEQGCISLIALTSTRFGIPENPGLILEFDINGERVEGLTLAAGPFVAQYMSVPLAAASDTSRPVGDK